MSKPVVMERGVEYRDADKVALIPVRNMATEHETLLHRPKWMKIKLPADSTRIQGIKAAMRKDSLYSVYEEASCPNLAECFSHDTATFMILDAICTRRCPFYDAAHGRPVAPGANEPVKLAQTIAGMALHRVVIISVDRDDLRDGGTQHFADRVTAIWKRSPQIKIKTLVPDFRDRVDRTLSILTATPPDVFNHNLESVPRIYRQIQPGADYNWSLKLLECFEEAHPEIPTRSGLMVGLGETNEEITGVMHDLRRRGVTILALGQYLQPSHHHLPVQHYTSPDELGEMRAEMLAVGFTHATYDPFVCSSYHADLRAKEMEIK